MIGVIATIRVVDGAGPDIEAVFREIKAAVRDNEPGNISFDFFRSQADPNCYKVVETYRDDDALQAHRQNAALKAAAAKMAPFKDGPTQAEYFDHLD